MDSGIPAGWEKDSATLYLHESGVRIEKRLYREKEGWILVPVDLDTPVSEFSPDKEGLAAAFAAWQKGAAKTKVKPAPAKKTEKAKAKKKAKAGDDDDDKDKDAGPKGEDDDEDGEKEEKEEKEEDEDDDD
jgi:hypothetical protein